MYPPRPSSGKTLPAARIASRSRGSGDEDEAGDCETVSIGPSKSGGIEYQREATPGSFRWAVPGAFTCVSFADVWWVPRGATQSLATDLFVIGGAQVYEAFLPSIEKWIITEVPLTVKGADAFMPEGYLEAFKETDSKPIGDGLVVKFYERS